MSNQLLEFVNKKVSEGTKVILVGKKEIKWEMPRGVFRLDSLNDDPKSILETICGKNRRILSNNISLEDIKLIDSIELPCQGGIVEDGSIWIKKDSKITDKSYQLISNAKCFVPILYEDDIYSNFENIENKWGNISEDYFIFNSNKKANYIPNCNVIDTINQTVIIFISSY